MSKVRFPFESIFFAFSLAAHKNNDILADSFVTLINVIVSLVVDFPMLVPFFHVS